MSLDRTMELSLDRRLIRGSAATHSGTTPQQPHGTGGTRRVGDRIWSAGRERLNGDAPLRHPGCLGCRGTVHESVVSKDGCDLLSGASTYSFAPHPRPTGSPDGW
jgi:hypothetical protein